MEQSLVSTVISYICSARTCWSWRYFTYLPSYKFSWPVEEQPRSQLHILHCLWLCSLVSLQNRPASFSLCCILIFQVFLVFHSVFLSVCRVLWVLEKIAWFAKFACFVPLGSGTARCNWDDSEEHKGKTPMRASTCCCPWPMLLAGRALW